MGTNHYSDSEVRKHGVKKMVVCPRFQISRFSCPSSSAWVCAFTSRRRIFSAPATASAATCSLSASLARAICWSMSTLAAANALGFGFGRGLRLVQHLRLALFRRTDDLADALARLGELFVRALARLLQLPPALLARGEAVRDLLLALLDFARQHRPNEFDRKPDEDREGEGLR